MLRKLHLVIGNGSSWANAANDIKAMINGINDAGANKVYVVLVASGTYKPDTSYPMKNHVALVGGFMADSYHQAEETRLDGSGTHGSVFRHVEYGNNSSLNSTVLLYGVSIVNGIGRGAGMNTYNFSPTLINVTFSGNKANNGGGGIYHDGNGRPLTLINAILWNNNGQIYLKNGTVDKETLNLYYSRISGGVNASVTIRGIRLHASRGSHPVIINSE